MRQRKNRKLAEGTNISVYVEQQVAEDIRSLVKRGYASSQSQFISDCINHQLQIYRPLLSTQEPEAA
jgi:metal-responsive CopG/Arc/MetJ family transcriptional regulator